MSPDRHLHGHLSRYGVLKVGLAVVAALLIVSTFVEVKITSGRNNDRSSEFFPQVFGPARSTNVSLLTLFVLSSIESGWRHESGGVRTLHNHSSALVSRTRNAADITFVISANPIPSLPSTCLADATLASLPIAKGADIILALDACNATLGHNCSAYEEFAAAMASREGIHVVRRPHNTSDLGLATLLKYALTFVHTEFVCVGQHDMSFTHPDEVDLAGVIGDMRRFLNITYVSFNHIGDNSVSQEIQVGAVGHADAVGVNLTSPDTGLTYMTTTVWTDATYVCRTAYLVELMNWCVTIPVHVYPEWCIKQAGKQRSPGKGTPARYFGQYNWSLFQTWRFGGVGHRRQINHMNGRRTKKCDQPTFAVGMPFRTNTPTSSAGVLNRSEVHVPSLHLPSRARVLELHPSQVSRPPRPLDTSANAKSNYGCVQCYDCGVGSRCGGWVLADGTIEMATHPSGTGPFRRLLPEPINVYWNDVDWRADIDFDGGNSSTHDSRKPGPQCLMHTDANDRMLNATPKFDPNFDESKLLPSSMWSNVSTVFVIRTGDGKSIFHSMFPLVSFVAWARRQNISLPATNVLVLLTGTSNPFLYVNRVVYFVASSLVATSGREQTPEVRPLGATYEKNWTDLIGVPPWSSALLWFENVYEGRTAALLPADFAALNTMGKTKLGLTDANCHDSPKVLVINREKGRGREIINFDEVVAASQRYFDDQASNANNMTVLAVDFGKFTPRQQFSMSLCARVMIAPHGAGLTWSLFMAPHSRVIEIFPVGATQCSRRYRSFMPAGVGTTDYHRFALGADHHFDCIVATTPASPTDNNKQWRARDIVVDVAELERVLRLSKTASLDRIAKIINE